MKLLAIVATLFLVAISSVSANAAQLIPITYYSRDMIGNLYTSGGSSDVSGTSSVVFKIAVKPTRCVRFLYANYQGTQAGESLATSTISVQSAIQTTADSGTPVQLTFGGGLTGSIPPGQQLYTDCAPATVVNALSANQYIAARTYVTFPSGGFLPTGDLTQVNPATNGYSGTAGDNYVQHTNIAANANGSNQLLTAGATSLWYSTNQSFNYGPLSLDGYAADGALRPIAIGVGDSIMQGATDSQDMWGGSFVRAMVQLGIPYYNVAKAGENAVNVYTGVGFSQRFDRARLGTIVFAEYGTNDLNGNTVTAATLEANQLNFWQLLSISGAPIIPVTLLPRPTSDACPISGQTVNTNLSTYETYNAWLRASYSAGAGNSAVYDAAQVGVTIPSNNGVPVIADVASYIESDANNTTPGGPSAPNTGGRYWCGTGNATTYSTDGTHPNYAAVQLMIPAYTNPTMQATIAATTPTTLQPFGPRFFSQ